MKTMMGFMEEMNCSSIIGSFASLHLQEADFSTKVPLTCIAKKQTLLILLYTVRWNYHWIVQNSIKNTYSRFGVWLLYRFNFWEWWSDFRSLKFILICLSVLKQNCSCLNWFYLEARILSYYFLFLLRTGGPT